MDSSSEADRAGSFFFSVLLDYLPLPFRSTFCLLNYFLVFLDSTLLFLFFQPCDEHDERQESEGKLNALASHNLLCFSAMIEVGIQQGLLTSKALVVLKTVL